MEKEKDTKTVDVMERWVKGEITTFQADRELYDLETRFCPKCGQMWAVHNDDGSCIED